MSGKNNAVLQFVSPVLVALGGGILVGAIAFLLIKIIPLLLVVPILIGTAIGFTMKKVLKGSPVSSLFGTMAVILMSVISYGTMHFIEYQDFKQNVSEHILSDSAPKFLSNLVEAVATPFVDDFFEMKTGHAGFRGYMIFSAGQPIRAGFGKMIDQGSVVAWILRLIEITLIISAGIFVIRSHSNAVNK